MWIILKNCFSFSIFSFENEKRNIKLKEWDSHTKRKKLWFKYIMKCKFQLKITIHSISHKYLEKWQKKNWLGLEKRTSSLHLTSSQNATRPVKNVCSVLHLQWRYNLRSRKFLPIFFLFDFSKNLGGAITPLGHQEDSPLRRRVHHQREQKLLARTGLCEKISTLISLSFSYHD